MYLTSFIINSVKKISTLCSFLFFLVCLKTNAQENYDSIIKKAKQGEIVSLPGFLRSKMPQLPYSKKIIGDVQLLMSDDPEYVTDSSAIVLKEKVKPGNVRLYVYNVNGVIQPQKMERKIVAIIKNTGSKTMHFQIKKKSTEKPSDNYYEIGKNGIADYYHSRSERLITLAPGKVMLIDTKMDNQIAQYNDLVHGIYEFHIDQPGEVIVLQTSPDIKGTDAASQIKYIVPTGHLNAGRGLFTPADYSIHVNDVVDTKNGPCVLTIADGKIDPWIKGYESNSNKEVELAGNYGVMYDITIPWKSSDGKSLALLTWNPMGGVGQWCDGMANSMIVSKGKFDSGVVKLPGNTLVVKKDPDAILVQVFQPAPNNGIQQIHIVYSPPGASCLPTPLVFMPVSLN